jgi:hypothetical protein
MRRNRDRNKHTETKNEQGEVRKTKTENIRYGEGKEEQRTK